MSFKMIYFMTKFMMNLLFTGFSIVLWMEPIYLAALELNLRNIQMNSLHDSVNYRLSIAVVIILSLDLLVASSALAIYAASHLTSASRTFNSALDAHINMIVLISAIICVTLSAYLTAVSMTHVANWSVSGSKAQNDLVALYGVGLKELIVSSYTLLSSFFTFVTNFIGQKSVRLGAAFTQSVSLFSVINYVLNGDRITATAFNSQQMIDSQIASPFNGVILLMLYGFIVIMTIAIIIQLGTIIISMFPFAPISVYATSLNLSHRQPMEQNTS